MARFCPLLIPCHNPFASLNKKSSRIYTSDPPLCMRSSLSTNAGSLRACRQIGSSESEACRCLKVLLKTKTEIPIFCHHFVGVSKQKVHTPRSRLADWLTARCAQAYVYACACACVIVCCLQCVCGWAFVGFCVCWRAFRFSSRIITV